MSSAISAQHSARRDDDSAIPGSSNGSPSSTRLTPDSDSENEDDLTLVESGRSGQSYRMKTLSSKAEKDGAVHEEDVGKEEEKEGFLPGRTRRTSTSTAESFQLYTPDEEKAVLRRLDRRLVLFMALLYMLSFLDRSNIGNARIAGLTRDLNLNSSQYEWLLTAFYITYILFEWMTLLYRLFPPHIYISLCVLSWGLIASLQSISTSFVVLVILRALLGISEAAFGPGVPFYLSFFFRRDELALRTGLFISAAPLATSFASTLAWTITRLGQSGPIAPWRLLFLVEGFPSVLVAVFAWNFIPDSPGTAKFLNARQRKIAALRLRKEKEVSEHDLSLKGHAARRSKSRGLNLKEIQQTLADPKCYLTAAMFFSSNVAFSSMPVFLPTIINEMGYTSLTSQALSAPPYLVSFLIVLITAYLSDRHHTRSIPILLHALLAAFGYLTIALAGHYRLSALYRYMGIYPACAGFFSAITIIITWTLNNQDSDSKRGTGVAMLNVIGQCGPLLGTRLYPDRDAPYYVRGMAVCAGFMVLVAVLAAVLRWVLVRENGWRRARVVARRAGGGEDGVPLVGHRGGHKQEEPFVFML